MRKAPASYRWVCERGIIWLTERRRTRGSSASWHALRRGDERALSIKLEEANDLLFRLVHADVKYIMVSGQQLKKIRAIKDQLPAVRKIIVLDEQAEYQDREMSLSEIRRMGKVYLGIHPIEEFLAIGQSLGNDDYATITYTSGTTADPKGVILTHRNYTANVEQALTCVDIDDTWRTLVILPLDHCFAHVVGFYIFMSKGAR